MKRREPSEQARNGRTADARLGADLRLAAARRTRRRSLGLTIALLLLASALTAARQRPLAESSQAESFPASPVSRQQADGLQTEHYRAARASACSAGPLEPRCGPLHERVDASVATALADQKEFVPFASWYEPTDGPQQRNARLAEGSSPTESCLDRPAEPR